jgi:di/tricarboxylate transporter
LGVVKRASGCGLRLGRFLPVNKLTEASEIKRLNENLTFLERERKRREAMNSNKMKVVGAILVGALGAVSTYLINWVVNKIIPGGIPPK